MRLSDEQWIARARDRVAHGEPRDGTPGSAVAEVAESVVEDGRNPVEASRRCCPCCDAHPPMESAGRLPSSTPLMRCPACYGFWAAGDALASGVRDTDDEHPSVIAAMAPPRCRSCFGHLKPDGICAKCGKAAPPLNCPACHQPMQRTAQKDVTIDVCGHCRGVWFDVGELGHAYGLQPYQDLPASLVDDHVCDNEPTRRLVVAETVLRMMAPFL